MKLISLNQEQLNTYLAKQKYSQFLQSWEWGEFQKSVNGVESVDRIGIVKEDKLVFVATLIKKVLPKGKRYFYSPRIDLNNLSKDETEFLFLEIKKKAKIENVIFLRIDPLFPIKDVDFKMYKTISVQPEKTIVLDITKSKEDLMKAMHQKTRYNIRLSKKKGVNIIKDGLERFDEFWEIMQETNKRDGFRLHSKEYYKKMFNNNSELKIKLYLAEYEGKIIAGNIVSFFGDMATYVHGASSNKNRNVMAPYLLQWQAINDAKEEDCSYYDFYGIDENKWPGVTRFKRGFAGEEIDYPGTYDLVFDRLWYNVYMFVRKIRRAF